MKKLLFALVLIPMFLLWCLGCSGDTSVGTLAPDEPQQGGFEVAYEKPVDFKQYEVHVSTITGFNPTGWDPAYDNGTNNPPGKWIGAPNAPTDWDGDTNTLYTISTTEPIQVTGLTPGTAYYCRVVVVDKTNQRSIPSQEFSEVAGDSQRSSTVVVAAADASPRSKAGADYVCTGVDDQVIINLAMAEIPAAGNGKLVLTEGTFITSDRINPPAKIAIEGQGSGTIIKLKDNCGKSVNIFNIVHESSDVLIKNLVINGNGSNNMGWTYPGIFLYTYCSNITIENVEVFGCSMHGIDASGVNPRIISCRIHDNSWDGIRVRSANNAQVASNHIYNNSENGVAIVSSTSTIVSDNHIYENGYNGLYIWQAVRAQVDGNSVYGNGKNSNNNYSNVFIENACTQNVIQNNQVRRGDLANRARYGIRVNDSTCTSTLISHNDCFESGVTAGISNAGTSTSFGAGNRNNNGVWSTTPN